MKIGACEPDERRRRSDGLKGFRLGVIVKLAFFVHPNRVRSFIFNRHLFIDKTNLNRWNSDFLSRFSGSVISGRKAAVPSF